MSGWDRHREKKKGKNILSPIHIHPLLEIINTMDWRHITCLYFFLINYKYCQIRYSYVIQFIRSKNLTIGLLNPGSLGTGHDEFIVALLRHDVDVMAINETWLRTGEEARAPVPPGYRLRHMPRQAGSRSRGGGVGFYIKRDINVRLLAHPPAPLVEQMWLSLYINGHRMVIGTAYRPPWLNIDTFIDALSNSVCSFSMFDHILLLGDFNINLLNASDSNTKKLTDFLTCMNLTQYVDIPTHFTDHSETLIDLLCSTTQIFDVNVDYIPDLSSHAFITCKLHTKKSKPPPKWITYRPLRDINLEDFQNDVESINWNSLISGSVSGMVEALSANILCLYDYHAPVKKSCVRERTYPWITYNIKEMMTLRDKAHARSRKTGQTSHKKYYKDLKNIVDHALKQEKTAYFQKHINHNLHNPRLLWKNIKNNVADFKSSGSDLPSHLSDPDSINTHFLTIPGKSEVNLSNLSYYEFHRYGSAVFSFKPVSEFTVLKIIKSISTNAQGIDGISLDMILLTLPHTLGLITAIVNESIESGTFPDAWKTSIVRPIPKTNNPAGYKDLRPISILPFLSKIVEKAVCMQVTNFLEQNNILPKKQSGFRKGHGTATALLDVVDNILAAQDVGEGTILALLDFSRAFETLNISLLLSKLSFYGFDNASVKWFESYLSGRFQLVELDHSDGSKAISVTAPVERGVPQGSILGPVLFVLYSADIIQKIKNCNYHLYADDLQLYISFKPNETFSAVCSLNEDLAGIAEYCERNSLVLNPVKSKFLVLGTKKCIEKIIASKPQVTISGDCLERVTEARNLGLLFGASLHFENHVLQTARNCFYRLGVLYRMRDYLSVDLRIRLCDSLILSKLNYADTVFGECVLARTKKLIQRIQNACTRFCFPIPRRSHVTPYLNEKGFLNMSARRSLHFATLLFGIVTDRKPLYLYEKLNFSDRLVRAATRLTCPRHSTAAFRGSFRYTATKCWNNLPPPIRNSKTLNIFKRNLRQHLLELQKTNV